MIDVGNNLILILASLFDPQSDILSYNKVMNAWRLCEPNKNDDGISPAEKAQEILDTICNEHDSGGELSPNDVTFSIGEVLRYRALT
jgi:hypothetical protein